MGLEYQSINILIHTFCNAIDASKEIRASFCDISKTFATFDPAIYESLLITYKIIIRVISKLELSLKGENIDCVYKLVSVIQGSILGHILFLLYINGIVNAIGSDICLFADETSLFIVVDNLLAAGNCLNTQLSS